MRVNAVITHEPPSYVGRAVEVEAVAQGATAEEATATLVQALELAPDIVRTAAAQPPIVTTIDVPLRVAEPRRVHRDRLLQRVTDLGWEIVDGAPDVVVLRPSSGGRVAAVPADALEIAPGVYSFLRFVPGNHDAAGGRDAEQMLGRVDELLARYPGGDDSTPLVREQRDARGGTSSARASS